MNNVYDNVFNYVMSETDRNTDSVWENVSTGILINVLENIRDIIMGNISENRDNVSRNIKTTNPTNSQIQKALDILKDSCILTNEST